MRHSERDSETDEEWDRLRESDVERETVRVCQCGIKVECSSVSKKSSCRKCVCVLHSNTLFGLQY